MELKKVKEDLANATASCEVLQKEYSEWHEKQVILEKEYERQLVLKEIYKKQKELEKKKAEKEELKRKILWEQKRYAELNEKLGKISQGKFCFARI